MEEISSLQNARVKRIVKLQRKPSFRRSEGLTVIEGAREVSRAIENGWQPSELWLCGKSSNDWKLECDFIQVSDAVFEKIAYRDSPDGILAVGPLIGRKLAELDLPENPLILVAEGVEKPGNLGALLRTADGAGADAVIVCDPATDLNNPNVIRNSIGTLFYLPVAEASSEETIAFLNGKGVRMLSAMPDAETVYTDCDLKGPLAIVVGAEDQGLSDVWRQVESAPDKFSNDWKILEVRIPMLGKNDSLNVSVSAAILMYEAVRQRES
ncbi:RNA methyltransferase [Tichowtungia aerotolerans]|uniref:RNA methyltransferase n=2 Tax=Tichowtungia aerotolerans TaxID=2697043 RepID=A0A6P1M888_9BACT|nr:RNA methyltransferase [Tichowtungia aerotolerans]